MAKRKTYNICLRCSRALSDPASKKNWLRSHLFKKDSLDCYARTRESWSNALSRCCMKYGINNVVGGFGRPMTPEESIPYALARTYIEHSSLRKILTRCYNWTRQRPKIAIELGCGFGRNIPVLEEFADKVLGIERDQELSGIAQRLNPTSVIMRHAVEDYECLDTGVHDLVLTFTFLQHLTSEQREVALKTIRRITAPGALVVICEETDQSKSEPGCVSLDPDELSKFLPEFRLLGVEPRVIEATFYGRVSGSYMIFKKDL